jgi:hypothetical protein
MVHKKQPKGSVSVSTNKRKLEDMIGGSGSSHGNGRTAPATPAKRLPDFSGRSAKRLR